MATEFEVLAGEIKIRGKYFSPSPGGREIYPVLCLCHGIPGGRPGTSPFAPSYERIARELSGKGFFTLTFNFRGTGRSEGNFDLAGWKKDLAAVLTYVKTLPRVEKINLLGFSAGGALALHHAVRDEDICSLVLAACPASFDFMVGVKNLEEILKTLRERGIIRDKDFPRDPEEWLKGALSLRPQEEIHRFAPRPLLLLHGTLDRIVPLDHAYRLYRAAGQPKELKVMEGLGHRLRQYPEVIDTAADWIKRVKG
ncbi:MAG: alpha/beta fold hydrolase [Candidatus Syntrophonatronum acetioxidans]|uniref:Alpha/beta fold hydrolase n=1 Tax=Candidatus Syntrophonatronum acetioxidans TaxID=1795816 RepID=A0A424YEU9_9FIRM|nr:MAG: alpha/beta fold hydrolase [Candidatus Syntrophonatronum acetioxidans]